MNTEIWVAIITTSMAVIVTIINKCGDKKKLTDAISSIAKGTKLGLENDRVIFQAFRTNNINGESEAQERKMEAYFLETTAGTYGSWYK